MQSNKIKNLSEFKNVSEFSTRPETGAVPGDSQSFGRLTYKIEVFVDGKWVVQQEVRSLESAWIQARKLISSFGSENLRIISNVHNGKRRIYSIEYASLPDQNDFFPGYIGQHFSFLKNTIHGSPLFRLAILAGIGSAYAIVGSIIYRLLQMVDGMLF